MQAKTVWMEGVEFMVCYCWRMGRTTRGVCGDGDMRGGCGGLIPECSLCLLC